jgi:hypothetical protein
MGTRAWPGTAGTAGMAGPNHGVSQQAALVWGCRAAVKPQVGSGGKGAGPPVPRHRYTIKTTGILRSSRPPPSGGLRVPHSAERRAAGGRRDLWRLTPADRVACVGVAGGCGAGRVRRRANLWPGPLGAGLKFATTGSQGREGEGGGHRGEEVERCPAPEVSGEGGGSRHAAHALPRAGKRGSSAAPSRGCMRNSRRVFDPGRRRHSARGPRQSARLAVSGAHRVAMDPPCAYFTPSSTPGTA